MRDHEYCERQKEQVYKHNQVQMMRHRHRQLIKTHLVDVVRHPAEDGLQ